MFLGLANYSFLTLKFLMQRTNVSAGSKEQSLEGFSNMPRGEFECYSCQRGRGPQTRAVDCR